jgi:diguanylate cyclase (GGDEF)-like protein
VSWFPYGDALLPYILYIAFLLVAMSAASIMSLITSFRMGVTFLSMTLLPLTIRLFTLQDYSATMTGITCILFYVIYLRMAQRLHLSVIENISLRIENRDLALRDSLTGLWNRRQLNNYIQWLEARASRGNAPYCVLLMDLDRFKTYNDTHGHAAGDQLLKDIAKVLGDLLRATDLPVRYGGEEFLMVLPDSSLTDAAEIAERIRANISSETNAEASIGVAALQSNEAFDQLVKRADAALYRAKAGGRNQVVVAESDLPDRI